MERNRIRCTSWKAQSLDINIIENLWFLIIREICSFMHKIIKSNDDLFNAVSGRASTKIYPEFT